MGQVPTDVDRLAELVADTDEFLLAAQEMLIDALRKALDEADDLRTANETRAAEAVLEPLRRAAQILAGNVSRIRDALIEIEREARAVSDAEANQIITNLSLILQTTEAQVRTLEAKLAAALEPVLDDSDSFIEQATQRLIDATSGLIGQADTNIGRLTGLFQAAVDALLSGVDADLAPLIQRVEDAVPAILADLGNALGGAGSFLADPIGAVQSGLAGGFTDLLTGFLKTKFDLGSEQIDAFVQQLEGSGAMGDVVKQFSGGGFIVAAIPGITFLLFLGQALAIAATTSFLAGEMQQVAQESMKRTRPGLMAIPEIREAMNRFPGVFEGLFNQLREFGMSEDKAQMTTDLRFVLLQVAENIELWRREAITEEEFDDRLAKLGHVGPNVTDLKTLAFIIPGVGDLIRMAVREVFTPEIAEKFGLFEDFPEALLPFTKASGLDEFWSRNFWAAHWELPSPNQGFEMLHRKAIDAETLQTLLRALDVMPFWREPLTKIAFNPLTRVDLRRMHALGLLTEGELQLRYEDLGFSPANAALMVEFTIAFNTQPDAEKEKIPNAFTRSQIVQFFRRGLFTEQMAVDSLVAIGWLPEGAQTIIDNEIIAEDTRDRDRRVRVIERRFVKGLIDRGDVFEQLDSIEVPEKERSELVAEMEAKRDEAVDLPSRSELDRFLRNQMITREEYMKGLEDDGIPEPWRTRFADLVELELEPGELAIEERLLTPSQIIRFLKRGIITADETLIRLRNRGFSDPDASLMIADAIDELPEDPRDFTRSLILALFKRERITEADATERLLALGFSAEDTSILIADVLSSIAEAAADESVPESEE